MIRAIESRTFNSAACVQDQIQIPWVCLAETVAIWSNTRYKRSSCGKFPGNIGFPEAVQVLVYPLEIGMATMQSRHVLNPGVQEEAMAAAHSFYQTTNMKEKVKK